MTTNAPSIQPRAAPSARRPGRIVGIASGKGGVGKTWFAITLTHALARLGRRTLLVDGDLGLANVDIQLGLIPSADIAAVVAGTRTLNEIVHRHEEGFDVLAGRSGSGTLAGLSGAALERLLLELRCHARQYDLVILDLGAGLDTAVRRLTSFADGLLLVVTEDPTSLTDAYAVLKLHAADAGVLEKVGIVVNQAASRAAGERTFATLTRACTTFLGSAPTLSGVIRRDERVRDAIRRQTPLLTRHPSTAAATDVENIASALTIR